MAGCRDAVPSAPAQLDRLGHRKAPGFGAHVVVGLGPRGHSRREVLATREGMSAGAQRGHGVGDGHRMLRAPPEQRLTTRPVAPILVVPGAVRSRK